MPPYVRMPEMSGPSCAGPPRPWMDLLGMKSKRLVIKAVLKGMAFITSGHNMAPDW